ncbi:MAG: hypothetical protein IKV46_01340 [Bacteroidales bacterium]|nr:hypothetical protein [Bacteroidales bacterium]
MKKTTIFLGLAILFSISLFAQRGGDWRTGKWHRNFPENLLNVHVSSNQIATQQSFTNPWSVGVTVGYENRIRPYNKTNKGSLAWGFHTGVQVYPGLGINHNATGANEEVEFGRYKTYTYIPLMASASIYVTTRPTASLFFQLAAGGNLLLGQRDFAVGENLIYVQKDPSNSIKASHFIPSARFLIGFMTELSPNLRFRGSFGIQGELGYTDTYQGRYVNDGYIAGEKVFSNDPALSTVVELGFAFSL